MAGLFYVIDEAVRIVCKSPLGSLPAGTIADGLWPRQKVSLLLVRCLRGGDPLGDIHGMEICSVSRRLLYRFEQLYR